MLGLRSAKDAATLIDPRLHPSPVAAIPFPSLLLPTSPQSFSCLSPRELKPSSSSPLHLSVPSPSALYEPLLTSIRAGLSRFGGFWSVL